MRGKRSLVVVEPPEDLFFLLAGKRVTVHEMKRRYIQAVYHRCESVVEAAKVLGITRNMVREYLT